jgi:hypothetical protein
MKMVEEKNTTSTKTQIPPKLKRGRSSLIENFAAKMLNTENCGEFWNFSVH